MSQTEAYNIKLSEEIIKEESYSTDSYEAGRKLYFEKAVDYLEINLNTLEVLGSVEEERGQEAAALRFSPEGELIGYGCSCHEFRLHYRGCRHIVAVMQTLYGYVRTIALLVSSRKEAARTSSKAVFNPVSVLKKNAGGLSAPEKPEIFSFMERASLLNHRDDGVFKEDEAHTGQGESLKSLAYRMDDRTRTFFNAYSRLSREEIAQGVEDKPLIRMEPLFYARRDHRNEGVYELEISLGDDKMYLVKNMVHFVRSMINGEPYILGKHFTYDPARSRWDPLSQELADLLVSLLADSRRLTRMESGEDSLGSWDRKITLTDWAVKSFLGIMSKHDKAFPFFLNQVRVGPVAVKKEAPNIKLVLSGVEGGFKLTYGPEARSLFRMDYEGRYLCCDRSIYEVDPKTTALLQPLIQYAAGRRDSELFIPEGAASLLYSTVVPALEKAAELTVDEALKDKYKREPLSISLHLDKAQGDKEGIRLQVDFIYGETHCNPLVSALPEEKAGPVLVRNMPMERKVIETIRGFGFEMGGDAYVLFGEDEIYEFVREGLPTLQAYADIFYSEDFKALKVKKNARFKTRVGLAADGSFLEFELENEALMPGELKNLLAAYRMKKKYYRLKKGGFLPLDDGHLESLENLMGRLDLDENALALGSVRIPRYRAFYLDSLAREDESLTLSESRDVKHMVKRISRPGELDYPVPESINSVLRAYQKVGFHWLCSLSDYGFGGILADDMGLGKTLQVIAFLLYKKQSGPQPFSPALVVAPTSLVYNWQEEVRKFTDGLKVTVISGAAKERKKQLEEMEGADLVVTSYALIKRDIDFYEGIRFSCLILDEAQHIKNPSTLNAQTVKRIGAGNYFALTGTPIENSLTELWSVFDFLMPGYLHSHGRFVQYYEAPIVKQQDNGALKDLSRHVRPFILRRMKKDVLKELPEKTESRVVCPMDEKQEAVYSAFLEDARERLEKEIMPNGYERSRIEILALLTRLRQICCHPALFIENYDGGSGKMDLFLELVENALDAGHRILVFSQFTAMLNLVRQALEEKGCTYYYLDGSTPAGVRMEMVNSFNKGEKELFLLSLKAGGTGLNLTGADTVIHLDPWWNPAAEDQATDRAYRIGQKNPVSVYKLVTRGTIEEKIYELQKRKRELVDAVITPGESLLTHMTEEEVKSLFF